VTKKNNVVLVTGAASGLGIAISKYLANKGYSVFGADMNNEGLKALKGFNISTVFMDVTNTSEIEKAYLVMKKSVGHIDVLINNAGIFDQIPMVEGYMNRYEELINVNVLGAYRVTHVMFPLLHKVKGRVINISSETAKTLLPFQTYGTSKYMMEAWSNTLRMELKLLDMQVSLIRAGGHKTPLMEKTLEIIENVPEDSIFAYALNKIKETGGKKVRAVQKDPEDVARTVYRAIRDKRPHRIYSVNESNLYKFLSILPRELKEFLVIRALR
jgi:short-subunit dehydrogenase